MKGNRKIHVELLWDITRQEDRNETQQGVSVPGAELSLQLKHNKTN